MATLPATSAPVKRGRSPAMESLSEQVEGHAYGVIAETGCANKHSVKAVMYDRMGDNAREQLWSLLETMEDELMEGDLSATLAGFQVIKQALRPQIEQMDRLEDEEYRYQATGHVAAARREGRDIVGLVVDRPARWRTEA